MPRSVLGPRATQARRYVGRHRRPRTHGGSLVGVAVRAALVSLLLALGLIVAEQATSSAVAGVEGARQWLSDLLPAPVIEPSTTGRATPAPPGLAGAPILDTLPTHQREARFVVSGRLPSYVAQSADRPRVDVIQNGALVASPATDEQGRFTATVTLAEGPNVFVVAAVRTAQRVESPPHTVIYDRTAPTVTISRPTDGATVDGPRVLVDGKTESGASVTVNGRSVSASPDGAFAETIQAAAGPLQIEVVVRDQAGNETKKQLKVTVKGEAAAAIGVTVSLDRTRVKPGESVQATIVVRAGSLPLPNAEVRVNVGLTQVASARTDFSGTVRVRVTAPNIEGFVQVIALATSPQGSGTGAALLEVKP